MNEPCETDAFPLLTFALSAYNQEDFIADAVSGALSQTYSPLEIILSDDCSFDRTFAIMEEMASEYKGPHSIILNRNLRNLGACGNINKIMELSSGALLVYAEGDDISLPERTSFIHKAWEYSGRALTSIYSDYEVIDKFGVTYGQTLAAVSEEPAFTIQRGDMAQFMRTHSPMVYGCTQAWSPRLFQEFGQLPHHLKYADFVISFRSLALNGILHIGRPLIKYRRHDTNFSFHAADAALDRKSAEAYDAKRLSVLQGTAISYETIINDIGVMRTEGYHSSQFLNKLEQQASRARTLCLLQCRMMSQRFFERIGALLRMVVQGEPGAALKLAPQALPRSLYHKSRGIKRAVQGWLPRRDSNFRCYGPGASK